MNWFGFLTPVVQGVTGFFKRKQEMKHAIHEKKIERIQQGDIAEVQWNKNARTNSGWMDDYMTIVLSLPLILSFFPEYVPYIREGFAVLEETPIWYRAAVAVMISAAFGYRKYADWQMSKHYTLPDPMDKIGV